MKKNTTNLIRWSTENILRGMKEVDRYKSYESLFRYQQEELQAYCDKNNLKMQTQGYYGVVILFRSTPVIIDLQTNEVYVKTSDNNIKHVTIEEGYNGIMPFITKVFAECLTDSIAVGNDIAEFLNEKEVMFSRTKIEEKRADVITTLFDNNVSVAIAVDSMMFGYQEIKADGTIGNLKNLQRWPDDDWRLIPELRRLTLTVI